MLVAYLVSTIMFPLVLSYLNHLIECMWSIFIRNLIYHSIYIYTPRPGVPEVYHVTPTFVDGFVDGFIQGYPNGYFLGRCPRSIANNWFTTLFFH